MKIDNYYQHLFLIRFLELSGVKKAEIGVSTSYLLQDHQVLKSSVKTCLLISSSCVKNREKSLRHVATEAKF